MNQEDPGDAQVFIDSMDKLRIELSQALLKHQVLQRQIEEAREMILWLKDTSTFPGPLDALKTEEVRAIILERAREWLAKWGE